MKYTLLLLLFPIILYSQNLDFNWVSSPYMSTALQYGIKNVNIDLTGNSYYCGNLKMDFYPSQNFTPSTSEWFIPCFSKFNNAGEQVWFRKINITGWPTNYQAGGQIADITFLSDNIYVGGYYQGKISYIDDFCNDCLPMNTYWQIGSQLVYNSAFYMKYDSNGDPQWVRQYDGGFDTGHNQVIAIENFNNELYIIIDNQMGYYNVFRNGIVFKLNNNGDIIWEKNLDQALGSPVDMKIDLDGNFIVLSYYNSDNPFNSTVDGIDVELHNNSLLLYKLDASGTLVWYKVVENGAGNSAVNSETSRLSINYNTIVINHTSSSQYSQYYYNSSTDSDEWNTIYTDFIKLDDVTISPETEFANTFDYILKFDFDGSLLWHTTITPAYTTKSIIIDECHNIYSAGYCNPNNDVVNVSQNNTSIITDNLNGVLLLEFSGEEEIVSSDIFQCNGSATFTCLQYNDSINSICVGGTNSSSNLSINNINVNGGLSYPFLVNFSSNCDLFSNEDIFCGDVNLDEQINSQDAALILQFIVGLIDLNEEQIENGDVNNDNSLNSQDAALVLQYIVGLINDFPGCE